MRLLLIEDNDRLAGFIGKSLVASGFAFDHCGTAEDGEAALSTVRYDALILDLGLPDGDGIDVLTRLRRHSPELPVLILTARDGVEDRVGGLNAGADDYLLKPFAMEELIARLNALLRRPGASLGRVLSVGDVSFDTVGREVTVSGTVARLSRRELSVLEALMRRAGRVVPKDVLEENVYGFEDLVGSNTIEVAVHRVRKKLQEAGAGADIHTLRGIGYLMAPADAPR